MLEHWAIHTDRPAFEGARRPGRCSCSTLMGPTPRPTADAGRAPTGWPGYAELAVRGARSRRRGFLAMVLSVRFSCFFPPCPATIAHHVRRQFSPDEDRSPSPHLI